MLDVWGYSDAKWTPILLHLSGLFVDFDPKTIDRNDFLIEDEEREGPIYECTHLAGTVSNGKLTGKWITPGASTTKRRSFVAQYLKVFR